MTALVKLLSLDLCLYIPEKKNYTLKYDRIYRSCRCVMRFQNFKFIPLGQMRVVNWRFLFYCKVYHLNYIYIVRSRQLIFYHQLMFVGIFILSLGVIWVWNNDIFCHIRLVPGIKAPSIFQRVDKWHSKIWLGMSCKGAIRL